MLKLIKRILRLKSIDRDRGTRPKQRPERVADEMKQPIFVNEDAEYCKYLMKFFKGKDEVE